MNNQTPITKHQLITNNQFLNNQTELPGVFFIGYSVIGYWSLIGYWCLVIGDCNLIFGYFG